MIQFSIEYGKQANGSLTKLAECGIDPAGTRSGLLKVNLSSRFSFLQAYTFGATSRVTSVDALHPCFLFWIAPFETGCRSKPNYPLHGPGSKRRFNWTSKEPCGWW